MNLTDSIFLLSDAAEDFMRVLYRQSKTAEAVKLNFLAAALRISLPCATETAQKLHEFGFVRYEKYGSISMTAKGAEYLKASLQKYLEKKNGNW